VSRKKRIGVIGTFVWDIIHGRDPLSGPVEEWGGITYSLSAFDAALPAHWELVPLVKVGDDLAPRAREFLRGLRHVASDARPVVVPFRNNRVEIFYHDAERRSEVLTGGVPGWNWIGLAPLVKDLDALYVNLLSGNELDLETARLLRQHFAGPIYCDLHSLVLGIRADGLRTWQPLPNAVEWCRCFDFVQANEDEVAMMAADPLVLAASAIAGGVQTLVVTLGSRGVVYFAAPSFERLSDLPPRDASRFALAAGTGTIKTALVPPRIAQVADGGDPTGCGDVWGATYFSRLVAGDIIADAMHAALEAAARNVEHRGATGLAHYLRGELSST
jgi:sugar/nucleoside kinase (ribokinase family)